MVAGFLMLSLFNNSCIKADVSSLSPKEDLVQGKWNINRIQLRLYSGGAFIKDTIIKAYPKPENFVNFGGNLSFQYKFNTTGTETGSYVFLGADSLIATTGINIYRWKMITLTKDLFTVFNTAPSDVYYPGGIVETYYTFVRYK